MNVIELKRTLVVVDKVYENFYEMVKDRGYNYHLDVSDVTGWLKLADYLGIDDAIDVDEFEKFINNCVVMKFTKYKNSYNGYVGQPSIELLTYLKQLAKNPKLTIQEYFVEQYEAEIIAITEDEIIGLKN